MYSAGIFALSLATFAVGAVTQISDGQVQAVSSSTPYSNPFTSYLTQTDSLGVITGQPAPVTSQPSVVTSQAAAVTSQALAVTSQVSAATFVSGSPGIPAIVSTPVTPGAPLGTGVAAVSSGFSSAVVGGGNSTVSTQSAPSSGLSSTPTSGSAGGASTSRSATAAASSAAAPGLVKPVAGLGLAGALFAAFL